MRTTPRASFPNYADRARFERIDERAECLDPTKRVNEIYHESKTLRRYGEHAGRDTVAFDLQDLADELLDYSDECADAARLRGDIVEWIGGEA